ncbi:hypothetical protein C0J52_04620 [Blattella germanica]|nr:hypothetical protein C0J52_04620 [Blattella germanica]
MVCPHNNYCTKIQGFQYYCRRFITTLIIPSLQTFIKRRKVLAHSLQYYYLYFSDDKIFSTNVGNTSKNLKIHYKLV